MPRYEKPQSGASAERHLVVRVGRLGDMVMITPALQALAALPSAPRLVLLTSPVGADLLGGAFPAIESVRVLGRRGWLRLGWTPSITRWIRAETFDAIWLFESAPRYRRMVGRVKCAVRQIDPDGVSPGHFAERCLGLIEPAPDPRPWARVPVSSRAAGKANQFLERAGIPAGTRLIGLHPGFSGAGKAMSSKGAKPPNQKAWPTDSWAILARRLDEWGRNRQPRVKVVMVLTPEEMDLGRRIEFASEGAAELLPPAPDLEVYAAVLSRYDLLIAPDTGPGHLAGAVGTPVVSLFAKNDPVDCAPYVPPDRLRVLRAEDMARPELGLAAIEPDAVVTAAQELWAATSPERGAL